MVPTAGHCSPTPPQETVKHSQAGLTPSFFWGGSGQCSFPLVLVHTRSRLCPLRVSVGTGFDFNTIAPLLPSHCGFSFVLDVGYLFWVHSNSLLSVVVQQLVAILVFSQEMSAHP